MSDSAASERRWEYITALTCGHRTFNVTSEPPNTGSIAKCDVCGQWVGVIVHAKEVTPK